MDKTESKDTAVLIERYLIGGIANIGAPAWLDASEILRPEHFGDSSCRTFFEAVAAVYERSEPIDEGTVAHEVARRTGQKAEEVFDLLIDMSRSAIGAEDNITGWARLVGQAHAKRLVRAAGQELAAGDGDVDERIAQALKTATDAAALVDRESTVVDAAEAMRRTLELITKASQAQGQIGIATGLDELDQMLAGLKGGELIILAARPAMGKTALALTIAEHAAITRKTPTMIFSLEMGADQLGMRVLSMRSGVDMGKLRVGAISASDKPRILDASNEISECPLTIDEGASTTLAKITARATRWRRQIGDQDALIVIDYLQLINAVGKANANKSDLIGDISRGLKQLARELRCPVLCLSQLNRDLEKRQDKRPQMSDLRDSGAIEQDADVILFVYRDEVYNPASADAGTAELIVGKQRSGSTGTVRLTYIANQTRFTNLAFDPFAAQALREYRPAA